MGFWRLFEVATMPIVQVMLISSLGAFLATGYSNILPADARKSMNQIVFYVFTPSLMFASLAKTVTFEDIISWWFMPVNIGLTFLIGGILGWIMVKILRPKPHLEGLIIATCSAGNLGNLMLITVPAICDEDGSPFGNHEVCKSVGLSYASFSMALGGFYIWTFTYNLIRSSSLKYKALEASDQFDAKTSNKDIDVDAHAPLLKGEEDYEHQVDIMVSTSIKSIEGIQEEDIVDKKSRSNIVEQSNVPFWKKLIEVLHRIVEELMAPPTLAAIVGLIFGAITWLKNLIIGENAPLRVIQNSLHLLGDGAIPCVMLILGGNLTKGLRSSNIKPSTAIGVICVKYIILPVIGIWVVKGANSLGFLPSDPLFRFVLMIQFTLPPAMNIGTITQLFDVGQEECSVLYLWTYLFAAIALSVWSTVYLWILS